MGFENCKKGYWYHLTCNLNAVDFEIINGILSPFSTKKNHLELNINQQEIYKNYREIYDFYISELHLKYKNNPVENILIFESPPESGKHFLINKNKNDAYYGCFHDKDYPEATTLPKDLISRFKKRADSTIFLKTFIDSSNPKSIKITNEGQLFLKKLFTVINSGIVYFDLMLLPIDLDKLRSKWKKKRFIGKKGFPVFLFEWSFVHFKQKSKLTYCKNCKIAIGTPLNTSVSIFEYYSDKLFKLDNGINFNLSILNSPMTFNVLNQRGTIIPLFKYNVIGSSNGPERPLVKNAFDIK